MSEEFNHTEAYEKDQPMGKAIKQVLDIAKEHSCPIAITAITEYEEGVSTLAMATHATEKRPLPMNVRLGLDVMKLSPNVLNLIEGILILDSAAEANMDQFMESMTELEKKIDQ